MPANMRITGASILFAVLTATGACGVGGDDPPITPPPPPGQPPPVEDGALCDATFLVSGTFTAGTTPRPIDPETNLPITGCWPVGTWTFNASVDSTDCATPPALLASYSFRVDRVTPPEGGNDTIQKLVNLTDVGNMSVHLAMSSNGQGCEGSFELGSADGKQYWNLKPTLPKDPAATAISGNGDFTLYKTNAWPWQ